MRPAGEDVGMARAMSKRPAPERPPEHLLAPLTVLPGTGPKSVELLAALLDRPVAKARLIDLLWHLPRGVVQHRRCPGLRQAQPGERVALQVSVRTHQPGFRDRQPHRVVCWAGDGFLHLVFFHGREAALRARFAEGAQLIVGGTLSRFGPEWQIVHPELVRTASVDADATVQAVYPLTHNVTSAALRRLIAAALGILPAVPEWHAAPLLAAQG